METTIAISNTDVSVKEYKGQRVVTLKDIDSVHGRVVGTARKRFNDNKKHFIEGEDYFKISPNEFRTAIGKMDKRQQNDVTLITESGYLMLAKSFTDDKAWDVQRALVKSYFRVKQEQPEYEQMKLTEKKYEYFDKFLDNEHKYIVFSVADIEHFTNKNLDLRQTFSSNKLVPRIDYFKFSEEALRDFKAVNPRLPRNIPEMYLFTESGTRKVCELLGVKIEMPRIEKKVSAPKRYVCDEVCKVMEYIRKEIKGIEALTYLIESLGTEEDISHYRDLLVKKLQAVSWWKLDTQTIKLSFHGSNRNTDIAINSGARGMRHIY